ncbi:MAG: M48 family metalloprotease [Terriglobales bacterium]
MTPIGHGVVPLTPAELASARQYLYGAIGWGVLAQIWMLGVLAAIYYSGVSSAWERALRRRWRGKWIVSAGLAALLAACVLLTLFPFDFYLGFLRERAFGFERLAAMAWLAEWAESSLLTVAVTVVVAAIAYAWALRRPRWWLRLWLVLSVGVIFAVTVQPVLIAPLFNRFTPVRDPARRAEIEGLARTAGIPRARILQMDASRQSAHTNAYVVGILGSQRIVVFDTLLETEPPAEVQFVVAHEIGHYVLHHLWKGVAFTLAFLLLLCALLAWLFPRLARGHAPGDIAALPLLLLILLALLFLAAPVTNGFSRWEEHQADAYGLALSHRACAAVASFAREERTDLIYPDPPGWMVWWFFNHPSQQQRIDFAQRSCR